MTAHAAADSCTGCFDGAYLDANPGKCVACGTGCAICTGAN